MKKQILIAVCTLIINCQVSVINSFAQAPQAFKYQTIARDNAGNIIASGSSKELKTKYLTNDILEVECDKAVEALDIIAKQPWVDETSIFGNYLHVSVKDESEARQKLKNLLTDQYSIGIKRIDKIIPTLEDVFIYLLEKDNKGENQNVE